MTLGDFREVFHGPLIGNCGYTETTAAEAITGKVTPPSANTSWMATMAALARQQVAIPAREDAEAFV